jgi:hypothetical protein
MNTVEARDMRTRIDNLAIRVRHLEDAADRAVETPVEWQGLRSLRPLVRSVPPLLRRNRTSLVAMALMQALIEAMRLVF